MAKRSGRSAEDGDKELVRRTRNGDRAAFRALVERYQNRIVRVAYSVLRDADEALDVAQEAFLRVYQRLDGFRGKSSFYTWLYRITFNLAIDKTRSRKRRQADSIDAEIEGAEGTFSFELPDKGPQPDLEAADKELEERINEAIESLSPKHRKVVLLREIEGLSYQEIAEASGCSIGTVMSRLHYARKRLQTLIAPYLSGRDLEG